MFGFIEQIFSKEGDKLCVHFSDPKYPQLPHRYIPFPEMIIVPIEGDVANVEVTIKCECGTRYPKAENMIKERFKDMNTLIEEEGGTIDTKISK